MTGCFHMTNFRESKWKRVLTFYTSLSLGTQQQTTASCSCIIFFIYIHVFYSFSLFFLFDQYGKFKSTGNEVHGHWGFRPVYVSLCEYQDYSACQEINLQKSKHWKTTQNHHYQTMRGWVKARYRTG